MEFQLALLSLQRCEDIFPELKAFSCTQGLAHQMGECTVLVFEQEARSDGGNDIMLTGSQPGVRLFVYAR